MASNVSGLSYRLGKSGFADALLGPPVANTRLLVLCDSIGSQVSSPRLAAGIIREWLNLSGFMVQGPLATGSDGWSNYQQAAPSGASFTNECAGNGVGGANPLAVTTAFAADCPNNLCNILTTASPPADDVELYRAHCVNAAVGGTDVPYRNGAWMIGRNIRAKSFVVHKGAQFGLRLRGGKAAGNGFTGVGTATSNAGTGAAAAAIATLDVDCGTSVLPTNTPCGSLRMFVDGSTSNATKRLGYLGMRFYDPNARNGLEVYLVGSSGWGWLDHADTAKCSDATMSLFLAALAPTAILYMLGLNLKGTAGSQETGGGNLEAGNYTQLKANAKATMLRFDTLLAATPPSALWVPHVSGIRTAVEMNAMRRAYCEIAEERSATGVINNYNGGQGFISTADGTHPTESGACSIARTIWQACRMARPTPMSPSSYVMAP